MEEIKKETQLDEDQIQSQEGEGFQEEVKDISAENDNVSEVGAETATAESNDVKSLQEALAQKNDALMRTIAEYQNYRKRVEKEKQDIMKYANDKIMKDLIAVHDNFERAINAMDKENEAIAPVVSGVEMIKKSFDDVLDRYGVKEIDAVGQPFDPEKHHAVMTEESEGHEDSTVLEVFQKGYTLHERVIRPAMVKVSN